MTQPIPLSVLLGRNTRLLREHAGVTTDELAKRLHPFGFRWQGSSVRALESGRSTVSVHLLLALSGAFSGLDETVGASDLLSAPDDTLVDLGNQALIRASFLRGFLQGEPGTIARAGFVDLVLNEESALELSRQGRSGLDSGRALYKMQKQLQSFGETERRVIDDLSISPAELVDWSVRLWNAPIADERDRRAGPDSTPQKRGRIMRDLKAELREAIEASADGDD